MTDNLSPQQSLENYFDDLLNGEELLPQPLPALLPVVKTPVQGYADNDVARQQKLTRLLQAMPQQTLVAPAPEAAITAAEVQDWETSSEVENLAVNESAKITDSAELGVDLIADLEWLANGRPAWAQKHFDVLLFQVSGLTLAVPLVSLGQIQPLTDELTPLFGQADWFMGLQPTATEKIRTVNTAKFVMPERYNEEFVKTARYVVSINGVPWGLAVDSVNQPIRLAPEDVNWRTQRSKRPWLAGTIKAHMCALLDIPRMGQMLLDADRNAPKKKTQR